MSVLKKKIEDIAKARGLDTFSSTKAKVTRYYHNDNLVDLEYASPVGGGTIRQIKIPLPVVTDGFKTSDIKVGSMVYINFINGSPLHPRVVSLADEQFARNSKKKLDHTRSGGLEISIPSPQKSKVNHIPYALRYIDKGNEEFSKYSKYSESSVSDFLEKSLRDFGNYEEGDIGITNPFNSSTCKILKNGTILLSVLNEINILLDPNTQKIKFKAINGDIGMCSKKWSIDCEDINISSRNISITTDSFKVNGKELK